MVVASQCAACHAKGFCSISDVAEKRIEIPNRGQAVEEGEEVTVALLAGLGLKAVWWAYVFPLLLLLIILLLLHSQNIPELYSGLAAVAAIALYYGVVWLFRNKFKRKYTFELVESRK